MSMWVYNRVICSEESKNIIVDSDYFRSINSRFVCYHLVEKKIGEDLYELRFETHGSDYYDKEIRHIIENYHEVKWYCTEEEIYEQGYYYWDKKVQFKTRAVCYGDNRSYDCIYLNYDSGLYIWWPKYSIAFYNDSEEYNLIIDDFDNFETYKYNLNVVDLDELKLILNIYSDDIYILLAKNSDYDCDDFILGELRIESYDLKEIEKNKYGELEYLKNHAIAYAIRDKLNNIIKKYNSDYKIKLSTCR